MEKRLFQVHVIIPTYRPDEKFYKLLEMLQKQTYPIQKIVIMNTEESCFPKETIRSSLEIQVEHLTREEFDHGGTRDRAASLVSGDLLLFMTQDAVPKDPFLVERLAETFSDDFVDAAYARQIPAEGCGVIEAYTRSFNYPKESSVKSKADLSVYGIKTFFCSNVCAMYRESTYHALGGFEKRTIFNEDMIFAGKIIRNGGKIAYVAEAEVVHSHNYSCMEQFHRNFDLAVSQAEHPEIFSMASSESEGLKLVKKTISYLIRVKKARLIPKLITVSGWKFLGYRLGKAYQRLPKRLVRKFSMNKSYWN